MPTTTELEHAPATATPASREELEAFIERLRRQLYAKRADLLVLLAELAADATDG